MIAWLLTWNPERWEWKNLSSTARKVQRGAAIHDGWSCGVTKTIAEGDRVFLIRLGQDPRGIVGSGRATSVPLRGRAWAGKPNDNPAWYIDLVWDGLLEPRQPPLSLRVLNRGKLARMHWSTQSSGIVISPQITATLERIWFNHYQRVCQRPPANLDDTFSNMGTPNSMHLDLDDFAASEGFLKKLYIKHRVREQRLRKLKIGEALRIGRLRCEVPGCDFDFEKIYGPLGSAAAEVHHIRSLAQSGPRKTRLRDLAVVCANCHRMIHHGGQCLPLPSLMTSLRR